MRTYDKLKAEEITKVAIGHSVIEPTPEDKTAEKEHTDKLAAIQNDSTLTDAQKQEQTRAENEQWQADHKPEKGQEIIYLTLFGGEKRSILRSELQFSKVLTERKAADFPLYAQRKVKDPNGIEGQDAIDSDQTQRLHPSPRDEQLVVDDENIPYPQPGDIFVEDFDTETEKFVQKVFDKPTFARYFKMSLN